MHIVNLVHTTGLLIENIGIYPVVWGNTFNFNIQFQQKFRYLTHHQIA